MTEKEPKRNIAREESLTPLPPEPDPNNPLVLQPPVHETRRVRLPRRTGNLIPTKDLNKPFFKEEK